MFKRIRMYCTTINACLSNLLAFHSSYEPQSSINGIGLLNMKRLII